jgi:hypothetical protein
MSKQPKAEGNITEDELVGHPVVLTWKGFYFIQDNLDFDFKAIVGKVMEHIEALGLSDKQENAVKSLIKDSIWKQAQRTYENIKFWIPASERSGVNRVESPKIW